MDLSHITPLVLTFNEAANIGRCLENLRWARRVVVLDSGSQDETVAIVSAFPNAFLVVRAFDSHAGQWNFGLTETGIDTDWVLALDADYGVTPAFVAELQRFEPADRVSGFQAAFDYCIDGRRLRAALYPPVTVLFRREGARFRQDGHTQRIEHAAGTLPLSVRLVHDDRKSLRHWLTSQAQYMHLEADKLLSSRWADLDWPDRIRLAYVLAPPLVFLYCLLGKGLLLDGRAGLFYALQRATAEAILSLTLLRRKPGGRRDQP